jgi:hypothetical protein
MSILRFSSFSRAVAIFTNPEPFTLSPIPWLCASLIYHAKGKAVKAKTPTSSPKGGAKEDEQKKG